MFVSVRDVMIEHAGFDSLVEGLRTLELACAEVQVSRQFAVKAFDGSDETFDLSVDEGLAGLRKHLTEMGVRISAFLLANDFNSADRDAEVSWVSEVVSAAGKLAVPVVRIDSAMTGQKDTSLDNRVGIFSDSLSRVIAETASSEVLLGIENHGAQGNDREFLRGVFDAVQSPRLGLTLDTGNFYWYGLPLSQVYETIVEFAPVTKHTHVKNINYPQDQREKTRPVGWEYGQYVSPLDEGDIDLAKVLDILRSVGYSGDLTIEDESLTKVPERERIDILQRDVQHLLNLL